MAAGQLRLKVPSVHQDLVSGIVITTIRPIPSPFISIVPNDPVAEQAVFQHLPSADVMDHQPPLPVHGSSPRYNADMRDATAQVPADDVARLVVVRVL